MSIEQLHYFEQMKIEESRFDRRSVVICLIRIIFHSAMETGESDSS